MVSINNPTQNNIKSIDKQIEMLQQKFKRIKEKGYVIGYQNNLTSVGATFEKLIGKDFDSLSKPDFFDIEIKTKLVHSKTCISLININPTGPTNKEINRLKNIYGYTDKRDNKLKTLNIVINAKKVEKIRNNFLFKLEIDRTMNRLYICILDLNLNLIEKRVYWDLDIIKNRVYQKLKILALVYAFTTKRNKMVYFKYYKINFYILKDFNTFLKLIESGKIKISMKQGNYYTKEKYGQTYSHGISFVIKKEDISDLFDIYK